MMASPRLAGIAAIAELCKPIVKGRIRGFALFQNVLDERLFAVFERLRFGKKFFDAVRLFSSSMCVILRQC